MVPQASTARAADHYRTLALSSRVEQADPHMLVSLLYDELLLSADVLAAAARKGHLIAGHPSAHKARSIIIALQAGLDFESGGEVAAILGTMYQALSLELEERLIEGNADRIAELRASIESVAQAWNGIVATS